MQVSFLTHKKSHDFCSFCCFREKNKRLSIERLVLDDAILFSHENNGNNGKSLIQRSFLLVIITLDMSY